MRGHAKDLNLFVNSTISKDRTEGRKQDDEEALKNLRGTEAYTLGWGVEVGRVVFNSRTRSNSTRSGSTEPVCIEVVKPPCVQQSHSPIPWRQDLEPWRSTMPQAYEQTDRGSKDESSVPESAAFKGLSKDKDEMKNDSLHEAMQEKVRLQTSSPCDFQNPLGFCNQLSYISESVASSLPSTFGEYRSR
jgi:hypothetical protein